MPTVADLAKNLKDRIWFTRIARIHAEKRLLSNELHSQLLLMFYSVYSIALSVTQLKYKPITDDAASVIGTVLSVTLFGLAFHLNARGFAARAQRLKENYTLLQILSGRIELAECQSNTTVLQNTIETVQAEYAVAIAGSENHITIDDRCSRFPYDKEKLSRPLGRWDVICIFVYKIGRFLGLAFLYASPVAIYSYSLCKMS